MVRPHLKTFWPSKGNSAGHSEKEEEIDRKEVGRQYKGVDRDGLC